MLRDGTLPLSTTELLGFERLTPDAVEEWLDNEL